MTSKPGACPNPGRSLRVYSECCANGVRRKVGATLYQALFWELREPVVTMLREKIQVAKSTRSRVSMRGTGTELFVVVRKHL